MCASDAELFRLHQSCDGRSPDETTILCQFAGLPLERISDETIILNFRRVLEKNGLAAGIQAALNDYLGDRGQSLCRGTIFNDSQIQADLSQSAP